MEQLLGYDYPSPGLPTHVPLLAAPSRTPSPRPQTISHHRSEQGARGYRHRRCDACRSPLWDDWISPLCHNCHLYDQNFGEGSVMLLYGNLPTQPTTDLVEPSGLQDPPCSTTGLRSPPLLLPNTAIANVDAAWTPQSMGKFPSPEPYTSIGIDLSAFEERSTDSATDGRGQWDLNLHSAFHNRDIQSVPVAHQVTEISRFEPLVHHPPPSHVSTATPSLQQLQEELSAAIRRVQQLEAAVTGLQASVPVPPTASDSLVVGIPHGTEPDSAAPGNTGLAGAVFLEAGKKERSEAISVGEADAVTLPVAAKDERPRKKRSKRKHKKEGGGSGRV